MTKEEQSLYNEMRKLSKRANQRILRIERLTGMTNAFSIKQLQDYLSSKVLNAWTKKGRVSSSKKFSEFEMKAIIKATNEFLNSGVSTIKGIAEYRNKLSQKEGIPLSIKDTNLLYQIKHNYTWIYDYFGSDFWDLARESVKDNWSQETFIDKVFSHIHDRTLDEELRRDLIELYEYTRGTRV